LLRSNALDPYFIVTGAKFGIFDYSYSAIMRFLHEEL